MTGVITSQNVTAPKQQNRLTYGNTGVITSQNVTAPKPRYPLRLKTRVSLPVRTSLHQNLIMSCWSELLCHYQSERHCTKTRWFHIPLGWLCHYQSERHCTKTRTIIVRWAKCVITSQNVTAPKLEVHPLQKLTRVITSQNVTAPKQWNDVRIDSSCVITSQNVTAPKLSARSVHFPIWCHYQSERHCTKTGGRVYTGGRRCHYQSERHCTKTHITFST